MKIFKNKLATLFTLATLIITGCQSPVLEEKQAMITADYWQNMESKLNKVNNITEQGRIGIINHNERGSANFYYTFNNDKLNIELTSPIGSQIGNLDVNKEGALLNFNGQIYKEDNESLLLYKLIGFTIDKYTLNKIILGIPKGEVKRDLQGRIIYAKTNDYEIIYGDFSEFNDIAIPKEITLKGSAETIKLKVNKVLEVK